MFFIIAGVSPKRVVLDDRPRICPRCGLAQAYTQRIDHYFNLFFIPLFRVKKGEPFLACNRCQGVDPGDTGEREAVCGSCGRAVDPSFTYCPHCGIRRK